MVLWGRGHLNFWFCNALPLVDTSPFSVTAFFLLKPFVLCNFQAPSFWLLVFWSIILRLTLHNVYSATYQTRWRLQEFMWRLHFHLFHLLHFTYFSTAILEPLLKMLSSEKITNILSLNHQKIIRLKCLNRKYTMLKVSSYLSHPLQGQL